MQGIFIYHMTCHFFVQDVDEHCSALFFFLQWFQDEMQSVRYFQPPCLNGLVQYSFKGPNSLKTATVTPLRPYGLQVWRETTKKGDHKYPFQS